INYSKVYIGLDLSRADDLTAISFIHLDETNKQYYITSHSFLGTKGGLQGKMERDLIDDRQLSEDGFCTITDLSSGIINTNRVLHKFETYVNSHKLTVQAIW